MRFLDEPTIGLDPESAEDLRAVIPQLASTGVTVLLTTHYMAEADQLCDRLAIVSEGRVLAEGAPVQIKQGFARVAVVDLTTSFVATADIDALGKLDGVRRVSVKRDDEVARVTLHTVAGADVSPALQRSSPTGMPLTSRLDHRPSRRPTSACSGPSSQV